MKAYVIVPIAYEYNDQCYSAENYDAPTTGFADRGRAEAELDRLNATFRAEQADPKNRYPIESYDGPYEVGFELKEIEVHE